MASALAEIVAALSAIGSVWLAYRTIVESRAASEQQNLQAQTARLYADHDELVRQPMLRQLAGSRTIPMARITELARLLKDNDLLAEGNAPLAEDAIVKCSSDVQEMLLDLRHELSVVAFAATEYELWDNMAKLLDRTEDDVLAQVASIGSHIASGERCDLLVSHMLAKVQREVVRHGKTLRRKVPAIRVG